MRLHFREYGRGAPLILLHGLFGSLDNWHPISLRLAGNYHVFALDQRNHGHSRHSDEMSYPLMAADLAGFLDEHGIGSAHVLGHSMGGKTAMQFARRHPAHVRKLVVVDVAPRAYSPRHTEVILALQTLRLEAFRTRREIEEELAGTVPDLAQRRFLLKNLARDEQGEFCWRINLEGIAHNYVNLSKAVEGHQPVPVPALFIRGGRSKYIRESDLADIQRQFPRAEFRMIPDAGHWVPFDAPGLFTSIVEEFLHQDAV